MGVSSLLGRVLEEKFSMVTVPSGGGKPSRVMSSTPWRADDDQKCQEYFSHGHVVEFSG